MIVAQHIKNLRLKNNYTQNYISHELKVSQKTYSNMESGKSKINLDQLKKLAIIYKTELTSFIEQISKTDSETVGEITKTHRGISSLELYNGINNDLPFELINQLKARIDDLNELVRAKDKYISKLDYEIETLKRKTI